MRTLLVVRRRGRIRVKSRSVLQLHYASEEGGGGIREYPLRNLDALLVIGRETYIESSALSVLAAMNIPVAVVAKDSVALLLNPTVVVTPHYRELQYKLPKAEKLGIALEYIKAKVRGLSNVLAYHRVDPPPTPQPPTYTGDAASYERAIRLWESTASGAMWRRIPALLREDRLEALRERYGFAGRKPRHPDPFNKALSVMYAVIYALATRALTAAGLDPTYGFLHRTRYSTPLTFDYTEMFKPIAVQATIELVNRRGLPELGGDGELTRRSVNDAIKALYSYLALRHKKTGRTPYQYIYLKAYALSRHLEGKLPRSRLAVVWNRRDYKL